MRSIVGVAVKEYDEQEANLRRTASGLFRSASNASITANAARRNVALDVENRIGSIDAGDFAIPKTPTMDQQAIEKKIVSPKTGHLTAEQIREAAMRIKRDQLKALVGLLARNNMTMDEFMQLSDEEQKRKLTSIARGSYYVGLDEFRFSSADVSNTLRDIVEFNKKLTPAYKRAVNTQGTVSNGRIYARHLPTEFVTAAAPVPHPHPPSRRRGGSPSHSATTSSSRHGNSTDRKRDKDTTTAAATNKSNKRTRSASPNKTRGATRGLNDIVLSGVKGKKEFVGQQRGLIVSRDSSPEKRTRGSSEHKDPASSSSSSSSSSSHASLTDYLNEGIKTVQFADARSRMLEIIRRTPLGNVRDPLTLKIQDTVPNEAFEQFQQQRREQRKQQKLSRFRGGAQQGGKSATSTSTPDTVTETMASIGRSSSRGADGNSSSSSSNSSSDSYQSGNGSNSNRRYGEGGRRGSSKSKSKGTRRSKSRGGASTPGEPRTVPRTMDDFVKYFDLLKMGVDRAAVIEKMLSEGYVDSPDEANRVLLLNPDLPLPSGFFPGDANLSGGGTGAGDGSGTGDGTGDGSGSGNGTGDRGSGSGNGTGDRGSDGGCGSGSGGTGQQQQPQQEGMVMVPAAQHADFAMFFQMVQMGLPVDAVKEKMRRYGLDAGVLDKKPGDFVPLATAMQYMAAGFDGKGPGRPGGPRGVGGVGGFGFGPGGPGGPGGAGGGFPAGHPGGYMGHPGNYSGFPAGAGYTGQPGGGVMGGGVNQGEEDDGAEGALTGLKKILPLGEHPLYEKYFRMLAVGMDKDDVRAHMEAVGLDPDMLDKSPKTMVSLIDPTGKGLPSAGAAGGEHGAAGHGGEAVAAADAGKEMVKVSEHPKYARFFKMLKVGMLRPAIRMKMETEGLNADMLDKDPNELIPLVEEEEKEEVVKACEHPKYAKFFKMLKVGMPMMAVRAKVEMEGLDVSIIEKDPNELIPLNDNKKEETVLAGEHPVYGQYFQMLKDGLSKAEVKTKMVQDGHDPTILDISPLEKIPVEVKKALKTKSGSFGSAFGSAKGSFSKASRKKKLYLKGLDSSRVKDSLWADQNSDDLGIDLDVDEFNKLFIKPETDEAAEREKQKAMRRASINAKQKVVLIDMKRAQNAGIALARVRFSHDDIRKKVQNLDAEGLSMDQLLSLQEFLPTPDEQRAVRVFTGNVQSLGLGEQYMIKMLDLDKATERIRAMIYKQGFKHRLHECKANIAKVENACDDVKMSGKLRKVLKIILKVVNQMHDDEGEKHQGISMDSLLKLETSKAFDKKTSVLQYVIKLIFRQDKEQLKFPEELPYVAEASRISLEAIIADKNQLSEEFNFNFDVVMGIEEKESTYKTGLMVDFLARADGQCKELSKRCDEVQKKFSSILAYFGEDASSTTSIEFFSTLNKFMLGFRSARDAVERIFRSEQLQEQAEKQRELRRSSMTAQTMQKKLQEANLLHSEQDSAPRRQSAVENTSKVIPPKSPPKHSRSSSRRHSTADLLQLSTSSAFPMKDGIASLDEYDEDHKHSHSLLINQHARTEQGLAAGKGKGKKTAAKSMYDVTSISRSNNDGNDDGDESAGSSTLSTPSRTIGTEAIGGGSDADERYSSPTTTTAATVGATTVGPTIAAEKVLSDSSNLSPDAPRKHKKERDKNRDKDGDKDREKKKDKHGEKDHDRERKKKKKDKHHKEKKDKQHNSTDLPTAAGTDTDNSHSHSHSHSYAPPVSESSEASEQHSSEKKKKSSHKKSKQAKQASPTKASPTGADAGTATGTSFSPLDMDLLEIEGAIPVLTPPLTGTTISVSGSTDENAAAVFSDAEKDDKQEATAADLQVPNTTVSPTTTTTTTTVTTTMPTDSVAAVVAAAHHKLRDKKQHKRNARFSVPDDAAALRTVLNRPAREAPTAAPNAAPPDSSYEDHSEEHHQHSANATADDDDDAEVTDANTTATTHTAAGYSEARAAAKQAKKKLMMAHRRRSVV